MISQSDTVTPVRALVFNVSSFTHPPSARFPEGPSVLFDRVSCFLFFPEATLTSTNTVNIRAGWALLTYRFLADLSEHP